MTTHALMTRALRELESGPGRNSQVAVELRVRLECWRDELPDAVAAAVFESDPLGDATDDTRKLALMTIAAGFDGVRSVGQLCTRRVYLSRRALGRRFNAAGWTPSRLLWLGRMARLLHLYAVQGNTLERASYAAEISGPFSASNACNRFLGARPTAVRERVAETHDVVAVLVDSLARFREYDSPGERVRR